MRRPYRNKSLPRAKFLRALTQSYNVASAAMFAGVPRRTVYAWRDSDRAFGRAWDLALVIAARTERDPIRQDLTSARLREVLHRGAHVPRRKPTARASDTRWDSGTEFAHPLGVAAHENSGVQLQNGTETPAWKSHFSVQSPSLTARIS